MNIQGLLSPTHLIRLCLEHEYAFSVTFKENVEIRVSHYKGTWKVLRMKEDVVTGWFSYCDSGALEQASDDFIQAFVCSVIETFKKDRNQFGEYHRSTDALLLSRLIQIIGGKDEDIITVSIVQPGRNALLNEDTGDFELYPRIEEFRK